MTNNISFYKISDFTGNITKIFAFFLPISWLIGYFYLFEFSQYEKISFSIVNSNLSLILMELSAIFYLIFLGLFYLLLAPIFFYLYIPSHVQEISNNKIQFLNIKLVRIFLLIQPMCFYFLIFTLIFKPAPYYLPIAILLNLANVTLFFLFFIKYQLGNKSEAAYFLFHSCIVAIFGFLLCCLLNILSTKSTILMDTKIFITYVAAQYCILFAFHDQSVQKPIQFWLWILAELIIFTLLCFNSLDPAKLIVIPILNMENTYLWPVPVQYYVTESEASLINKDLITSEAGLRFITQPLCNIIDDGTTIYTKTLSGHNLALTKSNVKKTDIYAKIYRIDACKKILIHDDF